MTTDNRLRSFRWTDQGNAKALAFLFGDSIRYCPENYLWYRWTSQIWEPCLPGEINQLAVQTSQRQRAAWEAVAVGEEGFDFRERALKYYGDCENRRRATACAATAADLPEMQIHFTQFDADKWKLGVLNGEIDLRTGRFSPPRKESYLTKRANVSFDPAARCPKWEKFISDISCGQEEEIEAKQRMLGYCLTGSNEEQVMFMCVGEGSNGKSTMFNVMRREMGDYAKVTPFSTFNASTRSEQSNDLASLAGARFVTISESDEDSWLAEAKLKAVTGSDPITCRFLHKEFFSYDPQFKIWMGTNQLPGIKGMNHGNFRRQIILHFNATFDGEKRINGLEDMLFAEASGILNWLIEGLMRWHEKKLMTHLPQSILDARKAYREDMDIVAKWLDECVDVVESELVVPIRSLDLYANYKEYATQMGHKAKGWRIWNQELKSKGHISKKSNGVMKFRNLKLRNGTEYLMDKKDWPETLEIKS